MVIGPDFPNLMCMIQNGNGYTPDLFQTVEPHVPEVEDEKL